MSLDTMFASISAEGWLVNNLWQAADATWCAQLRTDTQYTAFGRGPDPASALWEAMLAIPSATAYPPAPVHTWSLAPTPARTPNLLDLLNLSGRPTPPAGPAPTPRRL